MGLVASVKPTEVASPVKMAVSSLMAMSNVPLTIFGGLVFS